MWAERDGLAREFLSAQWAVIDTKRAARSYSLSRFIFMGSSLQKDLQLHTYKHSGQRLPGCEPQGGRGTPAPLLLCRLPPGLCGTPAGVHLTQIFWELWGWTWLQSKCHLYSSWGTPLAWACPHTVLSISPAWIRCHYTQQGTENSRAMPKSIQEKQYCLMFPKSYPFYPLHLFTEGIYFFSECSFKLRLIR